MIQVIQMLYEHAPDARAFTVEHELDAVLTRLVDKDESRLVQEHARVLLRAMIISGLV